ncbi:MAG: benzoate/H(+) symporter BenE family transporter [Burkholderiaceae bacterium]
MSVLEPYTQPPTTLARFFGDLNPTALANALIGFIFAATGPVAIILTVGTRGGLDQTQLASWVFGSFFINGLLSIFACWRYRMPLVFFWTIPGTVLVGPALTHLSFPEVVGAFHATGLLMLLLGLSGWVRRTMSAVPMPIVMGMVAGVFLQFGIDWILSLRDDLAMAGPMTAAFVVLSAIPALGRRMPPLIGALIVGAVLISLGATAGSVTPTGNWFGGPQPVLPAFSWQAMLELVVPLAITVLVVQNGQGVAVLHAAGHQAPINRITLACGLWSMLTAVVGTSSTCLTGPTNALISSSGRRESHYAAGVVVGLLALAFGLFSPAFTHILLATPPAFIATLAGLAMLRVLQAAFGGAFGENFRLGALISFLITVSAVSIWNIGAPFWGLVFGFLVSWTLERGDFASARARSNPDTDT